jgi:hypothetical protein
MALGSDYEVMIRTRLERAGQVSTPRYTIEGQQERFSLLGSADAGAAAGKVVLTGKLDGKLRFEGGPVVPFDVKGGESVRRARTLDDLLRSPWASRGVYQVLMYLLGTGQPLGLFVTDTGGLPGLIPIRLEEHLERAESFLAAAEVAYRCKHAWAPLPVFSSNPEDCTRCDHRGKSCAPPWYSGEGPWVSASAELSDVVEDVLAYGEAATAHARAKKRLQDLCRGKRLVVIGGHTITGKPHGKGWRLTIEGKEGDDEV